VGELRELDAQGVRGIRLNLESVSNHDPVVLRQALQHWGAHLADVGWHVQVYAPTGLIAACADTIRHLPVPCVLDHFALWSHVDCEDTDSQTVLQLLQEGHVYIKLSGSYRVSLGTEALQTLARRLIQTNVHRLLWASDWPHTNRAPGVCAPDESPYRDIDPSGLLQQRNHLLGTPEVIHQVLIDNAAHLYRF
jgi:predicted TIM-barrel fold metal-dependent hydrolase